MQRSDQRFPTRLMQISSTKCREVTRDFPQGLCREVPREFPFEKNTETIPNGRIESTRIYIIAEPRKYDSHV